jgi:hypothetical protein
MFPTFKVDLGIVSFKFMNLEIFLLNLKFGSKNLSCFILIEVHFQHLCHFFQYFMFVSLDLGTISLRTLGVCVVCYSSL